MCNFVVFLPVNSIRIINLKPTRSAKHMSGRQEKEICILFWWKYLKEKNRLEDQGLDL